MPADPRPTAPEAPAAAAPALAPLLLTARQSAALCGVSKATWDRLNAASKVPAPVRLGGRVLWRRTELEAWTAAGCADRRTWQAQASGRG